MSSSEAERQKRMERRGEQKEGEMERGEERDRFTECEEKA